MDTAEVEESLFAASDAKLHGGMCRKLSAIVYKVLEIFPELEAARPRSKSGIQALCSLHVALEKAKSLLRHCSNCSKLYLAITGDSIQIKFEKTKNSLEESLRRVEDIVPQAIGSQLLDIAHELEQSTFCLDQSEKRVGDEVISLLQQEKNIEFGSSDNNELEIFHRAAKRLGITSSRAALAERRAIKRLLDRARVEEDKRKESIVAYLLYLMRKYSKVFKNEFSDDNDSQGGSGPCSPTVQVCYEESGSSGEPRRDFERQFSKVSSFNFKTSSCFRSGGTPVPPEELRCPISLQLMHDPVIISSGQTYERACIEKWFEDGHSKCPKTQQQLSHLCLTPNYCVKGLIASWCEHNGVPIPDAPPQSLDLNYWRLALSDSEALNSLSMESFEAYQLKDAEVVSVDGCSNDEHLVEKGTNLAETYQEINDSEGNIVEGYDNLLSILNDGGSSKKMYEVVEQIRHLLKDDEEARLYMGANGFVEALVQFLRLAVNNNDEKAQEIGLMALFNLAVNNNRNKERILLSGVLSSLEEMILNSNVCDSATALYLNLSCLDEAKPKIGSSSAVSVLVRLLQPNTGTQCRLDALHTLYNLSTYPPNISCLLRNGIVKGLQSLLMGSSEHSWIEKSIAVLKNLAANKTGVNDIMSTPGLISILASILDTGEMLEQEQTVCCLFVLCNSDSRCCQIVLQEGVIPALVSISVNGTARGKEKAHKLLTLFREQRQRETSPAGMLQRAESSNSVSEPIPLCKPSRKKVGRTLTSLWKNKNLSVYQY